MARIANRKSNDSSVPAKKKPAKRKANKNSPDRDNNGLPVKVDTQFVNVNVPFKTLTDNQALYQKSIEDNVLTFGIGPAGVGKT
jgi:phosphate starvation-inducible protein PhoH